jgi:hypothetical protein
MQKRKKGGGRGERRSRNLLSFKRMGSKDDET